VPLLAALTLSGGVVGWTGNVNLPVVPGNYGVTVVSNLNPLAAPAVNVLGLGGEYSAGTMVSLFQVTNNPVTLSPVLLYKAGRNSTLDLRVTPVAGPGPLGVNTYTGGTIIAGGTIVVNDARQLNAAEGGTGGPIAILNGGRLRIAMGPAGAATFGVPIAINTAGTPNAVQNSGSVIEVDGGVTAMLTANFNFSWSPTGYLEKDGIGTLVYAAPPPAIGPGGGPANAWGLKLTQGSVQTNQLPVNPGADSGPVIFNGGNLQVYQVPAGMVLDANPAYGFRNFVSFQGTTSTVTVQNNAMFRTHGSVPNEILGIVRFQGTADADPSNNVVHLSRNLAPALPPALGDFSRGDGELSFQAVTVYMSGGGLGNQLNVLPREAGFDLRLNNGVVFNASQQNFVLGGVYFNNTVPANPVRIDGEEALPATPVPPPPPYYSFPLVAATWGIFGTGVTSWSGTTEKVGPGIVLLGRSMGAPVVVNAGALLRITGGTLQADGTADPFTDTTTMTQHLMIQNDASFRILAGLKHVASIGGMGVTTVDAGATLLVGSTGPVTQATFTVNGIADVGAVTVSGATSVGDGTNPASLLASSIVSDKLTIAAGGSVTIRETTAAEAGAVPEPATWVLLATAALGWLAFRRR
jgi:hypothetical protein